MPKIKRRFDGIKCGDESAAGRRKGECSEINFRNDSERSQRADHQLGQVVPWHVLPPAPAALGQISFAGYEFHSEHVIAGRAEKLPQRSVHAGGNRSAHRRAIEEGNAERKKLTLLSENSSQFLQRNSGSDG